jgi:hypothetical protein
MDPMPIDVENDEPVGGHGYGVGMQWLFVRLVLAGGTSLRGAARVLQILADASGWTAPVPHWTTGRLWLLRLGHAVLTGAKGRGGDWAWLVDHSVQIGQQKCLVILGVRLGDLPPPGRCLAHTDLELIALLPRKSWTRDEVDDALEAAAKTTGVPRVIVTDYGVDLHGGVGFFRGRHPRTKEVYDAKHKAACLLKARLEKNPRWQAFQQRLTQTRCAVQQTELGFLVPPGPKPKARFMNLAATLQWAGKVLAIVRNPPAEVQQHVRPERLRDKLGWLEEFATDIDEWSEWQALVNVVVEFVNRQGVYRGASAEVGARLPEHPRHASSAGLREELLAFVAQQGRQTRAGERFPGSTEVLESAFGRFKQLEKQQARGGFTSLLLGFGALLADATTKVIRHAMEHSRTKDIYGWCQAHLGTTVFAQRKLAFAASATKPG